MRVARRLSKASPIYANITMVLIANIVMAIVALAREISIAACLGTNSSADIYIISLFLNDLPGNLVLGNALFTVLLPLFTRMQATLDKDSLEYDHAFQLLRWVGIRVIAFYVLWMFFGYFAADILMTHGVPGLSESSKDLAVRLYHIMLPMGFFYCLYYVLGAKLNADRRFAAFAFGPVVMNVILLGCLWFGNEHWGILSLAWGSTLGSMAMFVLVATALFRSRKLGKWWQEAKGYRIDSLQVKSFFSILGPALLATLVLQVVPFSERYLGSYLPEGNIAALNYAYKLSQFPVWIFTAAVVSVLFPEMTARDETDKCQFAILLRRGLLVMLGVLVPVALVIIFFPEPLVKLLLERKAFVANSTALTAAILRAYGPGIVGAGLNLFLLRVYHSMHDTRTPLLAISFASIITVVGNVWAVHRYGAPGLAACASIGSWITTVFLMWKLAGKVPGWWRRQRRIENDMAA